MTELAVETLSVETTRHVTPTAGNAKVRWPTREVALLRLRAEGYEGWGEAAPLPNYSPDTFEAALAGLRSLVPDRLRVDLSNPRVSAEFVAARSVPENLPSARFALETALLDLAGQCLARPVAELLGAQDASPRPVAEVLTEIVHATRDAERASQAGIRAVKVKIGRPGAFARELAAIEAILDAYPDLRVRLDANQAFGTEAPVRLQALEPLAIEFIEEPGPAEVWLNEPPLGPPIALDETLLRPEARAVIERSAPRLAAVVLKPAVLGGLSAALAWAERAAGFGVPAVVSHLFDGPVAAAALRALALALPAGGPAHGLGLSRGGGSAVRPSTAPGLGFSAEGTDAARL